MTTRELTYAFSNTLGVQRQRLHALEAVLDPGTRRVLDQRGVGPGWRCLEVGAGAGSIASWLCKRVVPGGSVVATDLDITLLGELAHPNLEVRVHDVLNDELPQGEFDLVHLRLVLAWLAQPRQALRRLLAALKPGGWLVAEEMDFQSVAHPRDAGPSSRPVRPAQLRSLLRTAGRRRPVRRRSGGGRQRGTDGHVAGR
jgi:ubiquinone/menaquinone biosynthesis C-methylase UbiE